VRRHYSTDRIKTDIQHMKDLGLDTIELWPLMQWWREDGAPSTEPLFHQTDVVFHEAERHGMMVVPLLIGEHHDQEYAPSFFASEVRAPIRRMDQTPDPYEHNLCFNHPRVQEQVKWYFATGVRRYQHHPALLGWNVWDEPHFVCYCAHTVDAYRRWLVAKYRTLAALNDSWDTTYTEWHQVDPRFFTWASIMPAVDWTLFGMSNIRAVIAEWVAFVRALDPAHLVTCHPIGSMVGMDSIGMGVDEWDIAREIDVLGFSLYPKRRGHRSPMPDAPWFWAMNLDGMRSAASPRPFMVAELQTHYQGALKPETYARADELTRWIWQSVSHGARGVMYWMWYPFEQGQQLSGRGIVNLSGEATPRAEVVRAAGEVLQEHRELFAGTEPVPAEVGILYDPHVEIQMNVIASTIVRFLRAGEAPQNFYKLSLSGYYRALWEAGVGVDFVRGDRVGADGDALGRYRMIILPCYFVVDDRVADAVRRFVEGGGTVLADARLGVTDRLGKAHPVVPGCGLTTLFGATEDDLLPVLDDDRYALRQPSRCPAVAHLLGVEFAPALYHQRLSVQHADTVIGSFANGDPAVIWTKRGRGQAVLVGTAMGLAYLRQPTSAQLQLVRGLLEMAGVKPPVVVESPQAAVGVGRVIDARLLEGTHGRVLFVVNHGDVDHTVAVTVRAPVGSVATADRGGSWRPVHGRATLTVQRAEEGTKIQLELPARSVAVLNQGG